mmetsp:Transcript_12715/g.25810  ORF Transcript_12715/g.25810 Transcript_12715/m.25810 type:complete len:150 (-) Transcript_12715:150-599(-)
MMSFGRSGFVMVLFVTTSILRAAVLEETKLSMDEEGVEAMKQLYALSMNRTPVADTIRALFFHPSCSGRARNCLSEVRRHCSDRWESGLTFHCQSAIAFSETCAARLKCAKGRAIVKYARKVVVNSNDMDYLISSSSSPEPSTWEIPYI